MQQREISQLRHHVMDAVCASDDTKILHFCLVLLRGKTGESKNKQLFYDRLSDLANLESGWDGEGSKPISASILAFVGEALADIPNSLLEGWVLFPDARGYLYWDFTQGDDIAGITLTEDKMTAFVKKQGKLRKYTFDTLDEQNLKCILEEAHG